MANIANRSRYRVTVKNAPDVTRHFPYDQLEAVDAYMQELRAQGYKPKVKQLDESWLVRIRTKGQKDQTATFPSLKQAEAFIKRVEEERGRGLFVDYAKSLKVTLAELIVRYLLEESPKHKSHQVTAYCLEGCPTGRAAVNARPAEAGAQATESRTEYQRLTAIQVHAGVEAGIQLMSCLLHLQHLIGILEIHIKCCKLNLQPIDCMSSQFTVRTADQLPTLLQAFRKEAGLTQREVALRLGVAQQTYSALERNADTVGAARLLKLLNILGVELVLGKPDANPVPAKGSGQTPPASDQPSW